MKDFFISHSSKDKDITLWIAALMEKNGYSVITQEWDFNAGDNLVSDINNALKECDKLLVILSENYLKSAWCEAEWTSSFGNNRIIPIKIEPVEVKGLLAPLFYIDIIGKNEKEAEQAILQEVSGKPKNRVASNGFPSLFKTEHRQIIINYTIYDDRIEFEKTCYSLVKEDGKTFISNRLTWFPDEEVLIESLTDDITINKLDLPDTNINYQVVFPRMLKKGETVCYKIRVVATNHKKHFQNFVSTEIIVPIDRLTITVDIKNSVIKKYRTQVLSSSMNSNTTLPEKENDYEGLAYWEIDNPSLNYEYKLSW